MQKGWIDSPRRHVNRSIVAESEDDGGDRGRRGAIILAWHGITRGDRGSWDDEGWSRKV